jgi:hypothetical protein
VFGVGGESQKRVFGNPVGIVEDPGATEALRAAIPVATGGVSLVLKHTDRGRFIAAHGQILVATGSRGEVSTEDQHDRESRESEHVRQSY